MSKDIQQISEHQAIKMLKALWYDEDIANRCSEEVYLEKWKDRSYIKQSKLSEAREYYNSKNVGSESDFMKLKNLYEQAIEEIQE